MYDIVANDFKDFVSRPKTEGRSQEASEINRWYVEVTKAVEFKVLTPSALLPLTLTRGSRRVRTQRLASPNT